ncbi:neuronal acetylcholine receptor subunit alpha-7-like [Haliotis rufescens]|uniref:neuronal acetylcholine receptor subunit alpha-7-like n=1 Tax=Haliotis rufescens TaxID=6454 RepID=UPI001EB0443E|nr:neuronal acetylcholine receptor subunit alpha-7-like [Haliotis rufescens]
MAKNGKVICFCISLLLAVCCVPIADCAMASDVIRLFEDKINKNNLNVKPLLDQTETMHVNLSFNLVSITEFNEVDQRFSCNAWLDVYWKDELLVWNSSEYGDLQMVWPPNDKVWRPSLAVANIHNDFKTLEIKSGIVMVKHDGSAKWAPGEAFQTFCKVDISSYPFDKQRCDIEFFIWGMGLEEVVLHPLHDGINTDAYKKNGEWDILATKAHQEVRGTSTIMSMIVISFLLERRSFFYILNIVMPVLVLSILNVFVFLIPVESGEKISYGITVLLAFGVFMSFISDMLPQTSESICMLAVYMASLLILSAVFVSLSIIITRLHHKESFGDRVPKWIQNVTIALECLSCKKRRRIKPKDYEVRRGKEKVLSDEVIVQQAWEDNDPVTWTRVSRALDSFCFRFFTLAILIVTGLVMVKMKYGGNEMTIDSKIH